MDDYIELQMPELYAFQKKAITELQQPDKHICIAGCGAGKGSIALHWLKTTNKKKWLFITTASKRDSKDVENEMVMWFGKESLSSYSLEVISWAALAKWTITNWNSLEDYAFVFDEVACAKAGVSSNRGRAFIQIAKQTDCWTGYTATPGDRWEDFQAYFVAAGYVKNKTAFMREFCQVQTFKGYPEIVGYYDEHILKAYWKRLTVCPDTQAMLDELPAEQHKTYHFKPSPTYKRFLKERLDEDGNFIDTVMGYCHYCRRLCLTAEKLQWVSDYLSGLGTNAVFFYNYIAEGEELEKVAKKALPKGAKVWRIDGKHHDIPTADTIGKYDIVLAQYASGSESLNLQFMNHMVFVSPNYSYTTSIQARGRIKRIGQKQNMFFWYLVCDGTIETDVYACLRGKSDFAEDVWTLNKGLDLRNDKE